MEKERGERERERGTQIDSDEMSMNKYLSIITLTVNGLNTPIKSHKVAEWLRKQDPHICCQEETHLRTKDLHSSVSEEMEKNILRKCT